MPTRGAGPNDASEVYLEIVSRLEPNEEVDIDAVCARHAALADALRRVHQEWLSAHEALGLRDSSLAQSGGPTQGSWRAFLETLRSRGPSHKRYTFMAKIAVGGQGQINRVFDEDLDRPLAMKVMRGQVDVRPGGDTASVDDATLGRFLEEARITGRLDHPGIAPVHELGLDDSGHVYFTMKLVKGENFDTVIQKARAERDGWSRAGALNVLLRACEAVAYAHSRNVIHRDFKPSNIMVGRFGETYVMDWGLARILGNEDTIEPRDDDAPCSTVLRSVRDDADADSPDFAIETQQGAIVGTPSFMAPEQAAGHTEQVGPASDIYAAGAILYQLLSGRRPYDKPGVKISPRTILGLVLHGPPTPIRELVWDIPVELEAIVNMAMAREVGDRYASMLDLADDLRAFIEHRVVRAHRTGALAELAKWTRRNRLAAALALGFVLALPVLVLAASYIGHPRKEEVVLATGERAEVRHREQREAFVPPLEGGRWETEDGFRSPVDAEPNDVLPQPDRLRDAIDAWTQSYALNPAARLADMLGVMTLAAGDRDDALGWFRKSARGRADEHDAYHLLAEALRVLGRDSESIDIYQLGRADRPSCTTCAD